MPLASRPAPLAPRRPPLAPPSRAADRFLALSSHHALWHTRGGAGFAVEALLRGRARRQIAPHLAKLVPRLFRYCFDPAPRVREAMTRVW